MKSTYDEAFKAFLKAFVDFQGYEFPPENIREELDKKSDAFSLSSAKQLLNNPGKMIVSKGNDTSGFINDLLEMFWKPYSSEYIFQEMLEGDFSNELYEYTQDYIDRLYTLRPTIINAPIPDMEKIETFYNEALKTYGHGYFNASIALCASTIEGTLKAEIKRIDASLLNHPNGAPKTLGKINNTALDLNILDADTWKLAKYISDNRNLTLHNLRNNKQEIALKVITKSKNILIHISLLG